MYGQVFRQLGREYYCVCFHKKTPLFYLCKCTLSRVVVNSVTQGQ